MEKDLKQEAVGWTAFAFSSYFLLYPGIPFYHVLKGKLNYEDAPGTYATLNYINCFCWFWYSDMLYSDQIRVIASIGMVASGFFIIVYLAYEIKKYVLDTILNALLITSISYLIYLSLNFTIEDDTIIGKICAGTHILIFYFPMRIIYRVLKEKNYMLIPFCQAWSSLFMSICWVIYGNLISEI